MKIDDIVIVIDGSYSAEYKNGELRDALASIDWRNEIRRRWKVLAINCKLPISGTPDYPEYKFNDTIISPTDELNRIVFINSRFLQLLVEPRYCSQCGVKLLGD
jgi:hypothetical protein